MSTDERWSETLTFAELVSRGVLEVGDGYRAKNEELGGDGPIFLRAGHVNDTHIDFEEAERFQNPLSPQLGSKTARPGDVIVTTKGWSTGRVSHVSAAMPEFVYSPHLSYWRSLNAEVLAPVFLRYWSRSPECQRQLDAVKMTIDIHPYLSLATQKTLRISLPAPRDQRAIACILSTFDDKIDLLRQMNLTLENTCRTLFESWFSATLISARATTVQGLIDLGVLCVGDGYRAKRSEMAAEGLPFARAGNLDNGFHFTDLDFLGEPGVRAAGNKASEPWDVVFTSKGTIGRFAVVYPTTRRFVYSPQLCFWRSLDRAQLSPLFLLYWMRSRAFLNQVAAVSGQTDMALYVNLRDQRRMRIPLPPPDAQRELDARLAPFIDRMESNERHSATLVETRGTLLPKLFSGAFRIPDPERFLKEAGV